MVGEMLNYKKTHNNKNWRVMFNFFIFYIKAKSSVKIFCFSYQKLSPL